MQWGFSFNHQKPLSEQNLDELKASFERADKKKKAKKMVGGMTAIGGFGAVALTAIVTGFVPMEQKPVLFTMVCSGMVGLLGFAILSDQSHSEQKNKIKNEMLRRAWVDAAYTVLTGSPPPKDAHEKRDNREIIDVPYENLSKPKAAGSKPGF